MEKLKPGCACEICLSQGLNHKLRYFQINFEEQLLKCESRYCFWPHNYEELDSDCDQATSGQEVATNADDDDDFIKQLLEQLGSEAEEPETKPCSMPDLSATSFEPADSVACQIKSLPNNIIEAQSCEQKPCISPKSIPFRSPPKTLSNNDKLLSTTTTSTATTATPPTAIFSMPILKTESPSISNLLSDSCLQKSESSLMVSKNPEETKQSLVMATGHSAGNIEYKFSIQEQNSQKDIPKTNQTPQPSLIKAPKKASTLLRQQTKVQTKVQVPLPPQQQGASLSSFLDVLKQQEETRKAVKQERRKLAVSTGSNGGQPRTQLVLQLLQTLEARQKKEVKTES